MIIRLLTICFLLLSIYKSGFAFPRGDVHGQKAEPLVVMPLVEKAVQQLTVHDGVVDAMLGPTQPQFEVRVKKIDVDAIVVEIHNLSTHILQLELFQVMADGRFSPSPIEAIAPGARSIQIWKEPFDALGFGRASLLSVKAPEKNP
jgi:hypothetical protein